MAVFHTGLGRDGPGLLLRDIRRGTTDVLAARDALARLGPDVVLLLDVDHDLNGVALAAFGDLLALAGHPMPHVLALTPNRGLASGIDLDGDGRLGTADDSQGWGGFAGAGGMALLSRLPIDRGSLRDFSQMPWPDLPEARLPTLDGAPFPSIGVLRQQRLSTTNHVEVALTAPGGATLTVMAWHAGPPVFGGPHRRNFLRNADETAFWLHRFDGRLGPVPQTPFVLMGNANLDPSAGDGDRGVIRALLTRGEVQDPEPRGPDPATGAPSTTTAYWRDGPGALRVDYLLPSTDLQVLDSGLAWPSADAHHAMVWVDLLWPP